MVYVIHLILQTQNKFPTPKTGFNFKILLIFLLIVLGGIGIYFYLKTKNKKESSPLKTSSKIKSTIPTKVIFNILKRKGFTEKEIEIIYFFLIKFKISSPLAILQSQTNFKQFINRAISFAKTTPEITTKSERELLKNKLFKILNKIELNSGNTQNLLTTKDIKPNTRLRVKIGDYGYFSLKVLSINDKGIFISKPDRKDIKDWLKPVQVYFWNKDDAGYLFNSKIEKVIENKKLNALFLSHSINLKRYQKRKYIRKEAKFYVVFHEVEIKKRQDGSTTIVDTGEEYDGTIIEISASGACIETTKLININQRIKLKIYIKTDTIEAIAQIVWIENKRSKKYLHVKFVNISVEGQNKIFEYIFFQKKDKTKESI